MATPTLSDMRISLNDARFFYSQIEPIVRGPEHQQDSELIRRFFRGYLHCWKCVLHFVREALGPPIDKNKNAWEQWCKRWLQRLASSDQDVFECLRNTRDHDTHCGTIAVGGEIAAGLFPLVMFEPGKGY